MEKISIEVLVPAIGKKYEFIVPSVMKAGTAAELVSQAIIEQEDGVKIKEKLLFYSKDKECILQEDITIEKAGIRDGNILLLM